MGDNVLAELVSVVHVKLLLERRGVVRLACGCRERWRNTGSGNERSGMGFKVQEAWREW